MTGKGFLAVSQKKEIATATASGGFIVTEEALLGVTKWEVSRGPFLNSKQCRVPIRLVGVSVVLCDWVGAPLLIRGFNVPEARSVGLMLGGGFLALV